MLGPQHVMLAASANVVVASAACITRRVHGASSFTLMPRKWSHPPPRRISSSLLLIDVHTRTLFARIREWYTSPLGGPAPRRTAVSKGPGTTAALVESIGDRRDSAHRDPWRIAEGNCRRQRSLSRSVIPARVKSDKRVKRGTRKYPGRDRHPIRRRPARLSSIRAGSSSMRRSVYALLQ